MPGKRAMYTSQRPDSIELYANQRPSGENWNWSVVAFVLSRTLSLDCPSAANKKTVLSLVPCLRASIHLPSGDQASGKLNEPSFSSCRGDACPRVSIMIRVFGGG